MNVETRAIQGLELRAEPNEPVRIQGYAARFNSVSRDLGGFREVILPGAFRDSLEAQDDVFALREHSPSLVLGRRSAGSLKLREDDNGLKVTITPPDTQEGRDTVELIRSGHLDSMSFAFIAKAESWRKDAGEPVRELRAVDLRDVSVVAMPAYTETSVAVRSLEQHRESEVAAWAENQRLLLDLELARP